MTEMVYSQSIFTMRNRQTKLDKSGDIRPKQLKSFWLIVFTLPFCLFLESCFEENFVANTGITLEFSLDTLRFDTVFTTVGSATRFIKVFNPGSSNIIVNEINLVNNDSGPFRLNVDGIPANRVEDVEILANDSLYIFVEATIDPDQPLSISPFIITDQIRFNTGGADQFVSLEAWGQNANYFPGKDARGRLVRLTCGNSELVWDDPKPYVVYGLLFVDSCALIIAPGTQVYFHGGLARIDDLIFSDGGLVFQSGGRLEAQGTLDLPIRFQGDRLESGFNVSPGQWPGLRFLGASRDNRMNYTIIENSVVGIRVDSSASMNMSNSIIRNTSSTGIIGVHSDIQVDNTLVHSSGGQSCILSYGGTYQFRYCTFANFENQAPAIYMDNFTCLDADCTAIEMNPLRAQFTNTILAGSNEDEVVFADITDGMDNAAFDVFFDHCIVRIDESKLAIDFDAVCNNCIEWTDQALFQDQDNDLYNLDTLSVARSAGVYIDDLTLDLKGYVRDTQQPDVGCYEFQ